MLGGVVRVDANVFVGQVGGPESAGAFALMEMNVDGKLGLLEVGVGGVFVVYRGRARRYGRCATRRRRCRWFRGLLQRRSSRWRQRGGPSWGRSRPMRS